MTLTTILPTLRRSIPDPLDCNLWPEHTRATINDVVVCGVSMLDLTRLCGSPCIHSAAASIPGTAGRPSPLLDASVVLVTVTDIWRTPAGRVILVNADLTTAAPHWRETRLVGRVSTAHDQTATLLSGAAGLAEPAPTLQLPADLAAGDLLAIPCAGVPCLRDLRGEH